METQEQGAGQDEPEQVDEKARAEEAAAEAAARHEARFQRARKGARVVVHTSVVGPPRREVSVPGVVVEPVDAQGFAAVRLTPPRVGNADPKEVVWRIRPLTPERLARPGPLVDCYEPAQE